VPASCQPETPATGTCLHHTQMWKNHNSVAHQMMIKQTGVHSSPCAWGERTIHPHVQDTIAASPPTLRRRVSGLGMLPCLSASTQLNAAATHEVETLQAVTRSSCSCAATAQCLQPEQPRTMRSTGRS
jgi:hypothetical protein